MKLESNWDIEVIPLEIPGKDYDEKLVRLVGALLGILEKPEVRIEDVKPMEAA